jgi:hypothetical protein
MSEQITNEEEAVDETAKTEVEEPANAEKPAEGEAEAELEAKTEDPKEKARKGYELRTSAKKKEEEVSLSKKLEEVSSKVDQLTAEKNDLEFRRNNPNVSDDLFNLIKSTAKGSGKDYNEVLKDPVIARVLETESVKQRISGAVSAPSTRTSAGGAKSVWDMTDEEFKQYQTEVLLRGGR